MSYCKRRNPYKYWQTDVLRFVSVQYSTMNTVKALNRPPPPLYLHINTIILYKGTYFTVVAYASPTPSTFDESLHFAHSVSLCIQYYSGWNSYDYCRTPIPPTRYYTGSTSGQPAQPKMESAYLSTCIPCTIPASSVTEKRMMRNPSVLGFLIRAFATIG